MKTALVNLLTNGDMSGNLIAGPEQLTYIYGYAVQANYSGSPAGVLKLQASNDGVNFVDIADTTFAISAAGSTVINCTSSNYLYVQCVWTASGGSTGSLSVDIVIKGV